jgi:hypothetical protein
MVIENKERVRNYYRPERNRETSQSHVIQSPLLDPGTGKGQ